MPVINGIQRLLLIGTLLTGAAFALTFAGFNREVRVAGNANNTLTGNVTIPPLDTQVPEVTETATFAMG